MVRSLHEVETGIYKGSRKYSKRRKHGIIKEIKFSKKLMDIKYILYKVLFIIIKYYVTLYYLFHDLKVLIFTA